MTPSSVSIQVTPESAPSIPSWSAEVAAFAHRLTHVGILQAIGEQVHFVRARFGQYELLDFVVVLIGYAVSGEPMLLAFYERLLPFAEPFAFLQRNISGGLFLAICLSLSRCASRGLVAKLKTILILSLNA